MQLITGYGSVLAATVLLVLVRSRAFVHLGSYADFVGNLEALPHVWQDATFFVSFCVLTAYCTVPLAVLAWLALREGRASPRNFPRLLDVNYREWRVTGQPGMEDPQNFGRTVTLLGNAEVMVQRC